MKEFSRKISYCSMFEECLYPLHLNVPLGHIGWSDNQDIHLGASRYNHCSHNICHIIYMDWDYKCCFSPKHAFQQRPTTMNWHWSMRGKDTERFSVLYSNCRILWQHECKLRSAKKANVIELRQEQVVLPSWLGSQINQLFKQWTGI